MNIKEGNCRWFNNKINQSRFTMNFLWEILDFIISGLADYDALVVMLAYCCFCCWLELWVPLLCDGVVKLGTN